MLSSILGHVSTQNYMLYISVAVVFSIVVIIGIQILDFWENKKRMNLVTVNRDRIRMRERERALINKGENKTALRSNPGVISKDIVEKLDLKRWLNSEESTERLSQAGFRGLKAETTLLIAQLFCPIIALLISTIIIFGTPVYNFSLPIKGFIFVVSAYVGLKLPSYYLLDKAKKRRRSMVRAFPDAVDLLLICVESGMSVEQAFRKVSQEIGNSSIPLAEELLLTTAELSFLPDRRTAYENLYKRTEMESAKSLATVLVQADRYGTSLGGALRILSQDSRETRMQMAEKKAATVAPALTVPMIIFFIPALFIIILAPALIQIMGWK